MKRKSGSAPPPAPYTHPEATSPMRPEVGTQAQFKKTRPAVTYRYDSSLSPALDWDGQNAAREAGEALIAKLLEAKTLAEAKTAAEQLKALSRPFLDWAGKAERLSFDVPTLPLFVHERLSTQAILETLKSHRTDKQTSLFELFSDPQHSIKDQVLRAYEFQDKWVNRMILGDALVVMNSLLRYESLGGQVQMIYIDPPYGVKFGSNFQPFVRKRDVGHNDDEDLTREPEMVQAYRDTWELGLHSYLTYLRDRLLLARELLTPSGSIFVQISDDNIHHVREVMDEVFGSENAVSMISFKTTSSLAENLLGTSADYLLWYARDINQVKYRQLYLPKTLDDDVGNRFTRIELPDGSRRPMTSEERQDPGILPPGAKIYRHDNLVSQGSSPNTSVPFEFEKRIYNPGKNSHWKTTLPGLERLAQVGRLAAPTANSLTYVRYLDDFPVSAITNVWTDTQTGAFTEAKLYVVQTNTKVIARCINMTTDPGDLVLDPSCGSGTTAYVAEQWGRRWITIDVSRVPLALARQRLLTATFPWYELKDERRGPTGGFVYKRRQNQKGEEVGGIVPHVTLKSIANNEPPAEEILVDRPEEHKSITRVTGPFVFDATIPTPLDWEEAEDPDDTSKEYGSFTDRMVEILRRSPDLRLGGKRTVTLKNIRLPAKTLSLSAEGVVENGTSKPVALVFGPENGAVTEKLVSSAAREAHLKGYSHLYVIGFAIQPHARELIESLEDVAGIPGTYIQATPDLLMGDLLKNMRSSQIFSVCGLPEIDIRKISGKKKGEEAMFEVQLLGLDVFDPVTMQNEARVGLDVPAWFLDTNYNDLCFRVCQAFFPRTGAWENLKKHLKGEFEDSVWTHLSGDTSAPFTAGDLGKIAVKVIDDRGNELLVVKALPGVK